MPGKIKNGTVRKKVDSTKRIVRRAISLINKNSANKVKVKAANEYTVTINATNQDNVKALWGEILQFISIIQNYFQGKSKNKSEKNGNNYIGGSSNGPDSPVVNITLVFNINNYSGEQK